MADTHSIVMIGGTGGVGGATLKTLTQMPEVSRLTLLGRRPVAGVSGATVAQHTVDVFDPKSYAQYLAGHDTAICTLGAGTRKGMAHEEFVRLDKTLVLDFAAACKAAGVQHFELLSSVGANAKASTKYLSTKGELEDSLRALNFRRLSLCRPSFIVTPTARFGMQEAIVQAIWPLLTPFMAGRFRIYRGIPIAQLGCAMARNIRGDKSGTDILFYDDLVALATA